MTETLEGLQGEVGAWGEATFPHATPETITAHLLEEVGELGGFTRIVAERGDERLEINLEPTDGIRRRRVAMEGADVLLILLHLFHRFDVTALSEVRAKFEECKRRKWEHDPERGYVRHVEGGCAVPASGVTELVGEVLEVRG